MMESNIISVQKLVKCPLTGNLKNTLIWPRNLLINTENIVVSGETYFLIRFPKVVLHMSYLIVAFT